MVARERHEEDPMMCSRYRINPRTRDGVIECDATLDEAGRCPVCPPPGPAWRIGAPIPPDELELGRRLRLLEAAERKADRTSTPGCSACGGCGERVQGVPCVECKGWGELTHWGDTPRESFARHIGRKPMNYQPRAVAVDPWDVAPAVAFPGTTGDELPPF
jgi:hypothetical protein